MDEEVTECGRCGDCCTDISLTTTKKSMFMDVKWGDPRDDEVWVAWLARWADIDPPFVPKDGTRANWVRAYLDSSFIIKHWHGGKRGRRHPDGKERTVGWECDQFNPETRLCMAHDDRPPICRDFPYYTDDGKPANISSTRLPKRCSFWADFEEKDRPEGWAPVAFITAAR